MSRNYSRFVSCLVLLFVTLLSTPAANYRQAKAEENATFVVMRIYTAKGNSAKISVVEGEMATIIDAKTGRGYGFVPVVENLNELAIAVRTFKVVKTEAGITVGKEVARTGMKIGTQLQLDPIPFTIKAIAIVWDPKDPNVKSQPSNIPGLSLPQCCVECFGEVVCGQNVATDCGCCGSIHCPVQQ
jgi:hypothetical protein